MFGKSLASPTEGSVIPGTGPKQQNEADRMGVLYIHELYHPEWVSPEDAYKYVVGLPNQLVIDTPNDRLYRITHVNTESDLAPTLRPAFGTGQDDDSTDGIFGLAGGFQGEAVIGIDYSVRPNRAVIDGQVMCPGAAYALLYLGNVVGEKGKVISVLYGSNRELISHQIPVKLAAIHGLTNKEIKVTEPFSVNVNAEELPDGARVTLVWFDAAGNMIPKARTLSVMHTAILRDHQVSKRYIKKVELIAPWFTNSGNPEVLNVPINTQLKTLAFRAKVFYHDGSTSDELPIDGNKIKLYGINEHKPSTVGQRGSLTLVYDLDSDESMYEAHPGNPNQERRSYWIETTAFDGAYSPKIYSYPDWQGGTYRLRHYLTDLNRGFCIDVTEHVVLNELSPAFSPTTYGAEQSLELNLRLSDAVPTFNPTIIRQNITYTLKRPGGDDGSKFAVRYSYQGKNYNDVTLRAVTYGDGKQSLKFGMVFETEQAFLDALYHSVEPSYRGDYEEGPIKPTHFQIVSNSGKIYEYKLEQFNQTFLLDQAEPQGRLLTVRFIKTTTQGESLLLAVTGVSVNVKMGDQINPPVATTLQLDSQTPTQVPEGSVFEVRGMVYDQYGNPYRSGDGVVHLKGGMGGDRQTTTDLTGAFRFWCRPLAAAGETETLNFHLDLHDQAVVGLTVDVLTNDQAPTVTIYPYSPSKTQYNRPGRVLGKLTKDGVALPNYVFYYTLGNDLDAVTQFSTDTNGNFTINVPYVSDRTEVNVIFQDTSLTSTLIEWTETLIGEVVTTDKVIWLFEENEEIRLTGRVSDQNGAPLNLARVQLGVSPEWVGVIDDQTTELGQYVLIPDKAHFELDVDTDVVIFTDAGFIKTKVRVIPGTVE